MRFAAAFYKTENQRAVGLDELVADSAVVPQDAAQVETNWYLVQAKIGGNGNRNQNRNQGGLGNGSHAVVRRYEFYKHTGAYDPLTHEACADGLYSAPAGKDQCLPPVQPNTCKRFVKVQ